MVFYIVFSLSVVGLLSRGTCDANGSVRVGVRGNTRNLGGSGIMKMMQKPSISKKYSSGSTPVSDRENDSSEMEDDLVNGEQEEEDIVPLETFPQWRAEKGYWIGEYTLYQDDGTPRESVSWNYPYAAYKGFITGNTQGPAYRQRNVFLYPPQSPDKCAALEGADNVVLVVGEGTCGVNGNSRIFYADQVAGPESKHGSIDGTYGSIFNTKTELIGNDNALLYQVTFQEDGRLYQSQLTTLTTETNGTHRRTRNAQSFDFNGVPSGCSFYREYKVEQDEFYKQLQETLEEYNILESDTCAWQDSRTGTIEESPYTSGMDGCREHLQQSFDCFYDCEAI